MEFFLGDGDKRKHAISETFLFLKAVKRDVGRKGGGGGVKFMGRSRQCRGHESDYKFTGIADLTMEV